MATTERKNMNTQELTEAVGALLKLEQVRSDQERRKRRRRIRRRRKQADDRVVQLSRAIEVIKWCIVGITSVMVVALVVLIAVVMEVENEAERIKTEVQLIQREAEMIRDKIRHPLETLGGTLGRRLESNISGFIDGAESEK